MSKELLLQYGIPLIAVLLVLFVPKLFKSGTSLLADHIQEKLPAGETVNPNARLSTGQPFKVSSDGVPTKEAGEYLVELEKACFNAPKDFLYDCAKQRMSIASAMATWIRRREEEKVEIKKQVSANPSAAVPQIKV